MTRRVEVPARALLACAGLGWRQAAAERAALVGRGLMYLLIVVVFDAIWRATPLEELARPALDVARLVWYVAVTEWVLFAAGLTYRQVEAAYRSGAIEAQLTRPVAYSAATLARWAGAAAFRLVVLGAAGFAVAWWLTGVVPIAWMAAPTLVASGALGCALVLACQLAIGHATVWFGTAAPIFWLWQKTTFVLGGLLIPLALYPQPFRAAAELGPFAAMLAAPGSFVMAPDAGAIATTLALQTSWLVAVGALVVAVDHTALRRLLERGA